MSIIKFFAKNWADISLIVVGLLALIIYWLQERKKRIEAASLIVTQIDDIQNSIREISTYIVDKRLNETAFYESLPLLETNYWDKYKHYFVSLIDSRSYSAINQFYKYANEILEQQSLMKNLQKNYFYIQQNVIANMETNYLLKTFDECDETRVSNAAMEAMMNSSMPPELVGEHKDTFSKVIKQTLLNNVEHDANRFWNLYSQRKNRVHTVINNAAISEYIPVQIRESLEKAITATSLLEVVGCSGFLYLQKIAKRKF